MDLSAMLSKLNSNTWIDQLLDINQSQDAAASGQADTVHHAATQAQEAVRHAATQAHEDVNVLSLDLDEDRKRVHESITKLENAAMAALGNVETASRESAAQMIDVVYHKFEELMAGIVQGRKALSDSTAVMTSQNGTIEGLRRRLDEAVAILRGHNAVEDNMIEILKGTINRAVAVLTGNNADE